MALPKHSQKPADQRVTNPKKRAQKMEEKGIALDAKDAPEKRVFLNSNHLKDSKPLRSLFPATTAQTETDVSNSVKALIASGFKVKDTNLSHKKGVLNQKNTPKATTKALDRSIQKTYATHF